MANTVYGYPYPVGTDKVVDGDNAIKALAETLRPEGSMLASQAPIFGGSVPDPKQVKVGVYNMNIATSGAGDASFGNPFSTCVLGLWIQQVYNGTQNMAHFTMSGITASSISVLVRDPKTGANFGSQYFSVNIIIIGY